MFIFVVAVLDFITTVVEDGGIGTLVLMGVFRTEVEDGVTESEGTD
jgi:hypothetical protein